MIFPSPAGNARYADGDVRNGSGAVDPTRVIMNQVLCNDDGTVNNQFLKGIQGGTVNFNQTTGVMTVNVHGALCQQFQSHYTAGAYSYTSQRTWLINIRA